jgi:hypothetical protein
VLSLISIELFYFHRYSLHDRYIFVSLISFLIIIPVIRIGSRTAFFRFAGISRFTDLSHFKPFFITVNKRPAGATSDIGDDNEPLKHSCKLANPSDYIYIALFRHLLY